MNLIMLYCSAFVKIYTYLQVLAGRHVICMQGLFINFEVCFSELVHTYISHSRDAVQGIMPAVIHCVTGSSKLVYICIRNTAFCPIDIALPLLCLICFECLHKIDFVQSWTADCIVWHPFIYIGLESGYIYNEFWRINFFKLRYILTLLQ